MYPERASVSFNGDADSVEGGELYDSAARKELRAAWLMVREREVEKKRHLHESRTGPLGTI